MHGPIMSWLYIIYDQGCQTDSRVHGSLLTASKLSFSYPPIMLFSEGRGKNMALAMYGGKALIYTSGKMWWLEFTAEMGCESPGMHFCHWKWYLRQKVMEWPWDI